MENLTKNKPKLLVVDDLADIREFMRLHYQRRGFEVFVAGCAEDALLIFKEESPEIMLLDVNLPKMSGLEMLRLVREFNTVVQVIMVSGYDFDFQKDPEFQKLNVLEVMRKPVNFEKLDSSIARILEGGKQHEKRE